MSTSACGQVAHLQANLDCCTSYATTDVSSGVCTLLLPWCNRQLKWQVLVSMMPSLGPDVVFDDNTFQPLCAAQHIGSEAGTVRAILSSWQHEPRTDQLLRLVQALLACYRAHQLARLTATANAVSRLQFELATLDPQYQVEVQGDGTLSKACFSAPIGPIDLTPLMSLGAAFGCKPAAVGGAYGTPPAAAALPPPPTAAGSAACTVVAAEACATAAGAAPAASAASPSGYAAAYFKLHVVFRAAADADHSEAPELSLQLPQALLALQAPGAARSTAVALAPQLVLPVWAPHSCLAEYVPLVAERLQQQLSAHCAQLTLRKELVAHLGELLGPPLENNLGAGLAMFHLAFEGTLLLLHLELGAKFPQDKPALTVTCARQFTAPDASRTYRDYPWSPRWGAREMAARIFNWLKDELPSYMRGRLPPPSAGA